MEIFMRLIRRASVVLSLTMLPPLMTAQRDTTAKSPLTGVHKVTVSISLTSDSSGVISSDRLQTVVEPKLRTAGLRVLTEAEDSADPDILPSVAVSVNLMSAKDSRASGRLRLLRNGGDV